MCKNSERLSEAWCIGSDEFRKELLAQMTEKKGEHYGQEVRESAEEKATRLLLQELTRIRWREADLTKSPKGAPEKIAIALRLRKETTMTIAWIAQQLHMGTKTHLTHLLYWHERTPKTTYQY